MTTKPDQISGSRRVLVTGASGFIGRHLVRRLLGYGAVPDLLAHPDRAGSLDAETGPCRVHAGALEDPTRLRQIIRETKPEIVFHLAAFADRRRDQSLSDAAIACNVMATAALAGECLEIGVERFVSVGSSEEYGHQPVPFSETMPCQPVSPYSASKAAASLWIKMLADKYAFPAVLIRPFLVYGPGQQRPMLVPSAILSALAGDNFPMTNGSQTRELTYIDDVLDGLLSSVSQPAASARVFNLGSGQEHTVIEIVETIFRLSEATGRPCPGTIPIRPNEMQRIVADTSLADQILDWRATTPLEVGLEKTIAWTRANGARPMKIMP